MDYDYMKIHLYDMNADELFYKDYYYARQQEYSLQKFLSELDMADVLRRRLLVLEKEETIPPRFEDSYFFDLTDNNSIVVQRHNRYSPVILHEHTFFELVYVYDGKCKQNISGNEITMHTGDICIIPPEIRHSIAVFDDNIVFNVMLRRDTLHSIFYQFLNTNNMLSSFFLNDIYARKSNDYIIFHTGSDSAIKDAFLRMYWENQNKEQYYYECISSTLVLCFYLIVRNYGNSVEMPKFKQKLDVQRYALIQYIQENYRDITLSAVAAKFHYTPEYVSRLIKEATNMTYSEILLRIRMERAEEMLTNTNMTVAAIAGEIGYETTEHFIRQFKKYTRETPTAYRRGHAAALAVG